MKILTGLLLILMAATLWMAVVLVTFDFMMKELGNHKWITVVRFFWMVIPSMFIGSLVHKIQKHFNL